jgi:Cu/Ag efflux pump CusA
MAAFRLVVFVLSVVLIFCLIPAIVALAAYLKTHLRYHPDKKRFFLADWSMKFYDNKLNRRVGYARHALSGKADKI